MSGPSYAAAKKRPTKVVSVEETQEEAVTQAKPEGFPKHKGGGYYELSNGDVVKGRADAEAAEAVL